LQPDNHPEQQQGNEQQVQPPASKTTNNQEIARRRSMKRIVSASLGLAAVAAVIVATTMSTDRVRTVHAQSGCSLAMLKGSYGLLYSGFSAQRANGSAQFPIAATGVIAFDGAGNASGSFTISFNGKTTTGNPYNATYTVNPDCSGLLTSTDADSAAFAIVSGGAEVLATDVTAATTATLDLKKL
jgi:hypothetical protein